MFKNVFLPAKTESNICHILEYIYDVLGKKKSWSENYINPTCIDCCLQGCDYVRQQHNSTRRYGATFQRTCAFIIIAPERLRSYLYKCVKCTFNPIPTYSESQCVANIRKIHSTLQSKNGKNSHWTMVTLNSKPF